MADESRTIRVRCDTWDQVEAFYTDKIKANTLIVKMPQRPPLGAPVTVALGLPSGIVFAIDGQVVKTAAAPEGGKVPVAVRMLGLTREVRSQLERLVAEARAGLAGLRQRAQTRPPPIPPAPPAAAASPAAEPAPDAPLRVEDVPTDERAVFESLDALRRRLSEQAAHEVLGVAADAGPEEARRGYLNLAKKLHPDAYGKHRAPGIRRLAAEVFIHLGRAYDRMRGVAAPAAAVRDGWLIELPIEIAEAVPEAPIVDEPSQPYEDVQVIRAPAPPTPAEEFTDEVSFTTSVRMKALSAEDLFDEPQAPGARQPVAAAAPSLTTPAGNEASARVAFDAGRYRDACEILAQVLRADPRNRRLRALYHAAYGYDLRGRGEGVKATLQFETALAHDRDCEEARRALGQAPDKKSIFKKLFER